MPLKKLSIHDWCFRCIFEYLILFFLFVSFSHRVVRCLQKNYKEFPWKSNEMQNNENSQRFKCFAARCFLFKYFSDFFILDFLARNVGWIGKWIFVFGITDNDLRKIRKYIRRFGAICKVIHQQTPQSTRKICCSRMSSPIWLIYSSFLIERRF